MHTKTSLTLGEELLMGFQDVAFLPSGARLSTKFLKDLDRDESLVTNTYSKSVVGGKQRQALCKYFCSNKAYFCVR